MAPDRSFIVVDGGHLVDPANGKELAAPFITGAGWNLSPDGKLLVTWQGTLARIYQMGVLLNRNAP